MGTIDVKPLSSQWVKQLALELGFSRCGIARAKPLEDARHRFEDALAIGAHAGMRFLERDIVKRFDPSELLPGCKSVVVVLYNYLIEEQPASERYRMARFTWVEDYHCALAERIEELAGKIIPPEAHYRITVDSSCISEKNWAVEAGVGCFGKNGLVHNEDGSYFVMGTILTDCAADFYDSFRNSDCGECRLCQDKCPAKALETPFRVDASRCFAYHTVENKNPDNEILASSPFVFGCDVCQEVCPKNKKIHPTLTNILKSSLFLQLQNQEMEDLTEEDFKHYFGDTSIARRKYQRFHHAIEVKKQTIKNKEST